jgi:hypothetical protein
MAWHGRSDCAHGVGFCKYGCAIGLLIFLHKSSRREVKYPWAVMCDAARLVYASGKP